MRSELRCSTGWAVRTLVAAAVVTLLLILGAGSGRAMDDRWAIEYVDGFSGDVFNLGFVLDSKGHPHIAYISGDQFLHYTWWDGSAWQSADFYDEQLSYAYENSKIALALNSGDKPHIIYTIGSTLYYAAWDGKQWERDSIARTSDGPIHIALGSDDTPHIVYPTFKRHHLNDCFYPPSCNRSLYYAHREGDSWQIESVADYDNQDFIYIGGLAIDAADRPHVVYEVEGALNYARWTGSAWQIEAIFAGLSELRLKDFVLDSDDRPHLIFFARSSSPSKVLYGHDDGSGWHMETVAETNYGETASLAVTTGGEPGVAFRKADGIMQLAMRRSGAWELEQAPTDPTRDIKKTVIAFDGGGNPHISYLSIFYTGSSLDTILPFYTYHDGNAWIENSFVPPALVDGRFSLAVDAGNRMHVSYPYAVAAGDRDLRYARQEGGGWRSETVDGAGDVGRHPSLALDAAGRPHIAYRDETNTSLKYAHYDGSAWRIETVDNVADVGEDISLALDAAGRPHISYFAYTSAHLKYARWDGAVWHIVTVDESVADTGRYTSLALDANGQPHISYRDHTNGDLRYAYWDGASWHRQTVDSAGDVGRYTSIALDAAGWPHIAYADTTNERIKYASWDGASWGFSTLPYRLSSISARSLALDPSGNPFITFTELTNSFAEDPVGVYIFFRDGGEWKHLTIRDFKGLAPSLALTKEGEPRLAVSNNGVLAAVRPQENLWRSELVDRMVKPPYDGSNVNEIDFELDDADAPHLAYAYAVGCADYGTPGCPTLYEIKYAQRDGPVWRSELIDSALTVSTRFYGTRLRLDPQGRPHLTYTADFAESADDELRYARWTGNAWEKTVIDSGPVGVVSLALDQDGRPHVAYSKNGDLMYGRWGGVDWHIEIVDDDFNLTPRPSSLTLDSAGRPRIAYTDSSNGDLKFAAKTDAHWAIETVDSIGYLTLGDVTMDAAGRTHLCYHDWTENFEKYAVRDGTQWTLERVDIYYPYSSGKNRCSLTTDNVGRVYVSMSAIHSSVRAINMLAIRYGANNWEIQSVTDDSSVSAIALDSVGQIHISYEYLDWYGYTGELWYAVAPAVAYESTIYLPAVRSGMAVER